MRYFCFVFLLLNWKKLLAINIYKKKVIFATDKGPIMADPSSPSKRIQSWRTLKRETIIKDGFKHLEALRCQLPDGREFSPYYVDH